MRYATMSVSVCPSVCLWRKCIESRCMPRKGEGSSRAMLATVRPSCFIFVTTNLHRRTTRPSSFGARRAVWIAYNVRDAANWYRVASTRFLYNSSGVTWASPLYVITARSIISRFRRPRRCWSLDPRRAGGGRQKWSSVEVNTIHNMSGRRR